MLKEYLLGLNARKKNNTRKRKSSKRNILPWFLWKKNIKKKYKKRKKNIIQKLIAKLDSFSHLSGKNILFLSLWTLIAIIIILLFYGKVATLEKINIYREWALIDINRAYRQLEYIRGTNTLRVNSREIAEKLQKSQISLSEIRIDVSFPSTIDIFLKPYPIAFQTSTYFILSNGAVVEKANEVFQEIPPLIISEDLSEYVDFQKTLNQDEIIALQRVISESEKNILWLESSQIYYFITEREALLQDTSWTIYIFDINWDIESQVTKLAIYKKESEDTQVNYSYIDLRVGEKIFLCSRELKSTCENNLKNIYWNEVLTNFMKESSWSQQ